MSALRRQFRSTVQQTQALAQQVRAVPSAVDVFSSPSPVFLIVSPICRFSSPQTADAARRVLADDAAPSPASSPERSPEDGPHHQEQADAQATIRQLRAARNAAESMNAALWRKCGSLQAAVAALEAARREAETKALQTEINAKRRRTTATADQDLMKEVRGAAGDCGGGLKPELDSFWQLLRRLAEAETTTEKLQASLRECQAEREELRAAAQQREEGHSALLASKSQLQQLYQGWCAAAGGAITHIIIIARPTEQCVRTADLEELLSAQRARAAQLGKQVGEGACWIYCSPATLPPLAYSWRRRNMRCWWRSRWRKRPGRP
jgi:hypothetical protein